ncbi:DUF3419 family protein [Mariniblastus fucicola]|uniref:S-adenosylmethionine:diacylglycerol 3-amino-3-carboxypropyl transferase n=1 Tax=Mariniblastus fucicola TaxID=980251 RepID=A0A5B9PDH1_9BACT|nr:DUF3419 family protein [Mariniblastus fucicola]QEG22952.1 hypothetical protein MFFC18_28400 [Mariniblastus fucicola]
MTRQFFNQINYSSSNEDSEAELRVLSLSSADRVVCITGSGARTLDLLTAAPKKIVSVDFNPTQNHLLALKLAAYKTLDYADFLGFLGVRKSNQRLGLLPELLPLLPNDSEIWWRKHVKTIERGVLYCGTWEKLLRYMSKTTFLRQRKIDGLWNAKDLESQKEFWLQHWSGPFLKRFLRLLSNRFLWTRVIREPGAKLIPKDFDVGGYLSSCIEKMAFHSLIRENPYANLLFRGRYTGQCVLPLHLREENFEQLKRFADRVEIVSMPIDEFLNRSLEKFDAFSLSDFSSYAPPETYARIWESVLRSAAPKARFCERFFLVKLDQQESFGAFHRRIRSNKRLEEELAEIDHTCLYSFRAGFISED